MVSKKLTRSRTAFAIFLMVIVIIGATLLFFCFAKYNQPTSRFFKGITVLLAGDSRSSDDYTWYGELLTEKAGCEVRVEGASGKNAGYNASDEYFERVLDTPHDFSIWLVGGNDAGETGAVGTFRPDTQLAKAGEPVVQETDITKNYNGYCFIQAIDHIMRKYKAAFYNFKALDNSRIPVMIFCTDLPQQRKDASAGWSSHENWERKRCAIIECCEKNGIICLDLYELCHFDMTYEPYYQEPTDRENDNGIYFMDGLHPNKYGYDIITSIELDEMCRYKRSVFPR